MLNHGISLCSLLSFVSSQFIQKIIVYKEKVQFWSKHNSGDEVGILAREMGSHGRMKAFDARAESWVEYTERLEQYFIANGITEAAKKRAVLLAVVGVESYHLIRSLAAPAKPSEKSFEELVEIMKKHYNPRPSAIVQRYKFHTRIRQAGESIADYLAALRTLSEYCDFGAVLDDMLRDRLVCGVEDCSIQKKLLAEPTLT